MMKTHILTGSKSETAEAVTRIDGVNLGRCAIDFVNERTGEGDDFLTQVTKTRRQRRA